MQGHPWGCLCGPTKKPRFVVTLHMSKYGVRWDVMYTETDWALESFRLHKNAEMFCEGLTIFHEGKIERGCQLMDWARNGERH